MDDKGSIPSNPGMPQAPGIGPKPAAPSAPDLKFVNPTTPSPAPATNPTAPLAPGRAPIAPPLPTTPAAPAPAPQPTAPAKPQEYRTSIRTMSDDIAKIKSGQQPSGVDMKKTISATPVPPPTAAPKAPGLIPQPTVPDMRVGLGNTERAKPLAPASGFTIPSAAPVPAPTPSSDFSIPAESAPHRPSNRLYILIAIAALLVGALYWFLVARDGETIVEKTPVPTTTRTATPTPPKTLATMFGGTPEIVVLASSGNPSSDFLKKINAMPLTGGQIKKISVVTASKGAAELTPLGLLDRFLISYPLELKTALGEEGAIVLYGQKEAFDAKGVLMPAGTVKVRLGLISEVKNSTGAVQAMKTWEPTMTTALPSLLEFTKTKEATKTFLDNTYRQVGVRYKNFPYPDRSIDYAFVTGSNGKPYLLITSSREATFSIIDRMK